MKFNRSKFLKFLAVSLSALLFSSKSAKKLLAQSGKPLKPRTGRVISTNVDLSVVKGANIGDITRKSIEILGGMGKFVKKGDIVVIKPNIGWDRTVEQGADTHPEVITALIKMCFENGARKVKVFDNPCNDSFLTYKNSGIYSAVKKTKCKISYMNEWGYVPGEFPEGSMMADWPIYVEAVECDCFINVPVAKHHGLTKLTLSIKNLMGVCGGNRGQMHQDIARKLAEVTAFIKPELTVIDATRILLRNGPTGGSLSDVKKTDTVIAGRDPVLADSYAATLFNLKPEEIGYIVESSKAGLGNMNLAKANIKKIEI